MRRFTDEGKEIKDEEIAGIQSYDLRIWRLELYLYLCATITAFKGEMPSREEQWLVNK